MDRTNVLYIFWWTNIISFHHFISSNFLRTNDIVCSALCGLVVAFASLAIDLAGWEEHRPIGLIQIERRKSTKSDIGHIGCGSLCVCVCVPSNPNQNEKRKMKQEETLEDVLRCDYLILMDLLHFHEFALNQHLDISLSQYYIYSHTTITETAGAREKEGKTHSLDGSIFNRI